MTTLGVGPAASAERPRARRWCGLAACAALLLAPVAGAVLAAEPVATLGAGALLVLVLVAASLPAPVLPALALVVAVLVPWTYLVDFGHAALLSPANVVMGVFVVRSAPTMSARQRWAVGALAAHLLALAVLVAPGSRAVAVLWAALYLLLAAACLQRGEAVVGLVRAWVVTSGLVGLYAVLERAAGGNPLGVVFTATQYPVEQVWSTYRVTTTLGHPLVNGTFLAAGGALALSALLHGGSRWLLAALAGSVAGVALTGSRGAVLALVVGCAAAAALAPRGRGQWQRAATGAGVALGLSGLAALSLAPRLASDEARYSSQTRLAVLEAAVGRFTSGGWLGAGPGGSESALLGFASTLGDAPIESSPLQLALSLGLPGALAAAALLAVVLVRARRTSPHGAVLVLALVVAGATFNLLEGYAAHIGVFAAALACAVRGDASAPARPAEHGADVAAATTGSGRRA